MKRTLSFTVCFLVFVMLFSAFSSPAYASENTAELFTQCDGLLIPQRMHRAPKKPVFLQSDKSEKQQQSDISYPIFATVEAAGEYLRGKLTAHERFATVYLSVLPAPSAEDDIFVAASFHTGKPDEGDTIYWGVYEYYTDRYTTDLPGGAVCRIDYEFTYFTTAEEEAEADAKLAEIMEELNLDSLSDAGKIKAIYDYICSHVTYDHRNNLIRYSSYAAIVNGRAVCQGYAVMFYRMALTAGIDARLIAGSANGNHGWNIVELDGQYYNVDSTWDAERYPIYSYFLTGSQSFDKKHTRWEEYADFILHYPTPVIDYADRKDGQTVSGTYVSYNPARPSLVTLIGENGERYAVNTFGTDGKDLAETRFSFDSVKSGEYTLTVKKAGHLPHIITKITVTDEDIILPEPLVLLAGDVDGNGYINANDVIEIRLVSNMNRRTYEAGNLSADVNGDGLVNGVDVQIIRYVTNINKSVTDTTFSYDKIKDAQTK